MVRVTIAYLSARATGTHFDFDYYLGTHVPLAKRLLGPSGMTRIEVDRGFSGEERGSAARAVCVAHLLFESAERFYDAMALHGDELALDVPHYTDYDLEIQVSDVLLA
jgi:uncharacterized protein (TIGR02118 family)